MSSVAVFHPDLSSRGGGESVCMNVLEAIQSEHTVVLYTMADPEFELLNRYFGTDVDPDRVHVDSLGVRGSLMQSLSSAARRYTGRTFMRLQSAFLNRTVDRRDHDLVFSTYNEFSFDSPAVQYVHYPNFAGGNDSPVWRLYEQFCRFVDGFDERAIEASSLVANSEWTADVVEGVYGVRPSVVFPPVETDEFNESPWDDREPGFVCVGRIEPSKRILETIDVVERLRSRGHDTHLHVVGPTHDDKYREVVAERASESAFVHLEGAVSRDRLVELLSGHRYGIHAKIDEHFGIVVAEMVAAGAIPFVHDSGGAPEIVDRHDALCYRDTDEAVDRADRVLGDSHRQQRVRDGLPNAEARFGRERFKRQIAALVADRLGERHGGREP